MRSPEYKEPTPKESSVPSMAERQAEIGKADKKAYIDGASAGLASGAVLAVAGPAGVAAGAAVGLATAGIEMAVVRNKDRSWREICFGSDAKAKTDGSPASSETVMSDICSEWSSIKCSQASHFQDVMMDPVTKSAGLRPVVCGMDNRMIATQMDVIPDANIAQFTAPWSLCFNFFNPTVMSLSLAKAAVTGTFTLVPFPCALSRIPMPPMWVGCPPTIMVALAKPLKNAKMTYKTFMETGVVMPTIVPEFPVLTKNAVHSCIWPMGQFTIVSSGRNDNPVPYNAAMGLVGPSLCHCLRNIIGIAMNYVPLGKMLGSAKGRIGLGAIVLADSVFAGLIEGMEKDDLKAGIKAGLLNILATGVGFAFGGAMSKVFGTLLNGAARQFASKFVKQVVSHRPKFKFPKKGGGGGGGKGGGSGKISTGPSVKKPPTGAVERMNVPKSKPGGNAKGKEKLSEKDVLKKLEENRRPRQPDNYNHGKFEDIIGQDVRTLPGVKPPKPRKPQKIEAPQDTNKPSKPVETQNTEAPQDTNKPEGFQKFMKDTFNDGRGEKELGKIDHVDRGSTMQLNKVDPLGVQEGVGNLAGEKYDGIFGTDEPEASVADNPDIVPQKGSAKGDVATNGNESSNDAYSKYDI